MLRTNHITRQSRGLQVAATVNHQLRKKPQFSRLRQAAHLSASILSGAKRQGGITEKDRMTSTGEVIAILGLFECVAVKLRNDRTPPHVSSPLVSSWIFSAAHYAMPPQPRLENDDEG
ncbi:hypothetical protein VTI74DRAFT_10649 [Chaetomium olivicolor]